MEETTADHGLLKTEGLGLTVGIGPLSVLISVTHYIKFIECLLHARRMRLGVLLGARSRKLWVLG